jgi:hypothetical protein
MPGSAHIDLARGAGRDLRFQALMMTGDTRLLTDLSALARTGAPYASAVIEGAAAGEDYPPVARRIAPRQRECLRLLDRLPSDLRPAFARGIGLDCGRLVRRGIPSELDEIETLLRAIPATLLDTTLQGIDWGMADGGQSPGLPLGRLPFVPSPHHDSLQRGYAAGRLHVFGPRQALERLGDLPAEWRETNESLVLGG